MPEIRIQHVVSASSEDKHYPAANLQKGDGFKKWKCASGEKQAVVTLQFEKEAEVAQIDIGNEGSAFIEVLVGKSSVKDDEYQVILVASSFMTPQDSRASQNLNKVRLFTSDTLSQAVVGQKWDRAKVICTQPFNKNTSYGLSFIKFHSTPADTASTVVPSKAATTTTDSVKRPSLGAFSMKADVEDNSIKTGNLFSKNRQKSVTLPLSGAAAIRDASRAVAEAAATAVSVQLPDVTAEQKPSTSSRAAVTASTAAAAQPETSQTAAAKTKRRDYERTNSSGSEKGQTAVHSGKQSTSTSAAEQPPPAKKTKSSVEENGGPLGQVMSGVKFVLSGLQNPLRGQLRDKAIEMGAIYKPDWEKQCTHLICAFDNTPKYQQVRGLGRIVTKDWILDCHRHKKLLPWRKYRLGKAASPLPTDDESSDDVPVPVRKQKNVSRKHTSAASVGSSKAETNGAKQSGAVQGEGSKDIKRALTVQGEGSKDIKSKVEATTSRTTQPERKVKGQQATNTQDLFDVSTDSESDDQMLSKHSINSKQTIEHRPKLSPAPKVVEQRPRAHEGDIFNASTDEEGEGAGELPDLDTPPARRVEDNEDDLPVLPDFFGGKIFFLYGTFGTDERRSIIRYIVAYGGSIEEYMEKKVNFVISAEDWDENFDLALTENSSLVFVRPAWILACYDRQTVLPHQKYLIVP